MRAGALDPQSGIPLGAAGQPGRIAPARPVRVIRRRGDRRQPADRLDPAGRPVVVGERDHRLDGRSSAAAAKDARALREAPRWPDAARGPRAPAPSPAPPPRLAPPRQAPPHARPHGPTASASPSCSRSSPRSTGSPDHRLPCASTCSPTIRTARSRTSGAYLTDVLPVMAPSSHSQEPPVFVGSAMMRLRTASREPPG